MTQNQDASGKPAFTNLKDLPPVTRADESDRGKLSFAQKQIWLMAQSNEAANVSYNLPFGFHFQGPLNVAAFRNALNLLIARHEAFRTTFHSRNGQPSCSIKSAENMTFQLREVDLSDNPEIKSDLLSIITIEATTAFNLESGPLIRGQLIRESSDSYTFLFNAHHIIFDGWSVVLLFDEICNLYNSFDNDGNETSDHLETQYSDYCHWQHKWITEEFLRPQAEYWAKDLKSAPSFLSIPTDRPRPNEPNHTGAFVGYGFDAHLTRDLKALSSTHGVSLFVTVLSAWMVLLSELSGEQDIIVGSAIANRERKEVKKLVGLLAGVLPLRMHISAKQTVGELLLQVKAVLRKALKHQDLPFEQIVRLANPLRNPKYHPLFQTSFSWPVPPKVTPQLNGLKITPTDLVREKYGVSPAPSNATEFVTNRFDYILALFGGTNKETITKFDLAPIFWEFEGQIMGAIEYSTALFERSTVERYLGYWRQLLEAMVADDQQCINQLPMLDAAERHQVLEAWNDTACEFPEHLCVHELFEAQVAKTPMATAIVQGETELTYEQLNRQANQLAHHLRTLGIQPDDRIAICVERGPAMIVGLLAILKAGGAYVPLDPAYPAERLAYMLDDSAPRALLLEQNTQALFTNADALLTTIDIKASTWSDLLDTNPDKAGIGLTSAHLAYVIYTSGSTGNPKGVLVEHRNVGNYVQAMGKCFSVKQDSRFLQISSFSFDAFVFDFTMSLVRGAALFIPSSEHVLAGGILEEYLSKYQITHALITTGVLDTIADRSKLDSIHTLLVGGEKLSGTAVECWSHCPNFFNVYGPTETTVVATTYLCDSSDSIDPPIGSPIANTRTYVLDTNRQPVPVGVIGELYIGGGGVARGYLNQPELTAEHFLPDPFSTAGHARMYKTGDLVRWRADGNLDYVGRNDFQVKLRGFRIELGEIEARLREHEAIQNTVVVLREDNPGNKQIVAYCVPENAADALALEPALLRQYLLASLPEFMVPAAFVSLESIPLTPNGKVDRAALQSPEHTSYSQKIYEAPEGEVEGIIADIWSELLKHDHIGRHDNFFEIGGHSLLAVQVISRLRQALGIEVSLSELFAKPVLSDFAQSLSHAAQVQLPAITPVERDQPIPLSFAQHRLWFLSQLGEHVSRAYHMPLGLRLLGPLDRSALRQALDQIVIRHEALRTTFESVNDELVQRIAAATSSVFTLIEHDLKNHPEATSALEQLKTEEAEAPFDLHAGPLIRGRLITLADDEHVLLITQHHILSDGWSLGVLVSELSQLYAAYRNGDDNPLPPLEVQYADYAIWQRRWLTGPALQRQADYWKSTLTGAPAMLELPTNHPRPAEQNYAGGLLEFTLDVTLTQGIKSLCQQHGSTMFMTLLASWSLLMARLSGQNDVVIGTPTANRHHHELEGLIGFFVNTLAMRIDLSGAPSVEHLLLQVKQKALMALQHQDIPFEQVVELIQPERSLSHNPLFQVAFAWQNAPGEALQLEDLTLIPLSRIEHTTSIFDLSMHLWDAQDTITGALEYSTALFERSTVERYLGYWRQLLEAMVADDQQCIDQLPMLGAAERHQVLDAWNDTACEFPEHLCVHELFEAQVAKTPMATAIVQGETELTYEQLNRQANQLAHHLRTLGIQPDDRVAICVERGPAMIIGLLAILKAGGAYVPLDPAYPAERLAYMLDDSAPRALLLEENTQALFADSRHDLPRIDIKANTMDWAQQPDNNPNKADIGLKPDHLAYVIYTSGSTGNPKGVLVEHRNLNNLVHWHTKNFSLEQGQRSSCLAGFGFDASTWEIWPALSVGAMLSMPSEMQARNPDLLLSWWKKQTLDTSFLPTPMAELAFRQGPLNPGLKNLLVGGDRLKYLPSHSHSFRLFNNYGPTETTVVATSADINSTVSSIHIGRPISNTRVYVLDTNQQPVPIGVTGELYICGAGVARGYLNQPELTAERFLTDPFSTAGSARMYKTGDLVRWRVDGNLDYVGRNDFQVKLRGFRIELGEIETLLCEQDAVTNAVVVCNTKDDDKRLTAYLTLEMENEKGLSTVIKDEQIAKWQELYNTTYAQSKDMETSIDFIGWNSSYTAEPIPEIEMLEWRENTVSRIMSLKPDKVLEIGCGTGLLLFEIAPECSEYIACDFSKETIDRLSHKIKKSGLSQVRLLHREANDTADLENGHFDTIIINSVIQYFPTLDYLLDVIGKALKLLSPTGNLLIGDIRNLDLMETFHSSIQISRSRLEDNLLNVIDRTKQAIANEKELLIAPDLFLELRNRFPEIGDISVLPKLGLNRNELTNYRYDVIVHREPRDSVINQKTIDWLDSTFSTEKLSECLKSGMHDAILLLNIANPRVGFDLETANLLRKTEWSAPATLADLQEYQSQIPCPHDELDPRALVDLSENLGYHVELNWTNTSGPGTYHALLLKQTGFAKLVGFPETFFTPLSTGNKKQMANEPMTISAKTEIVNRIRSRLHARLPDYMVPTQFIVLDEMPLGPNGKIDRKSLPQPDLKQDKNDYVAPRTDTEKLLAKLWSDTLNIEKVGVLDNFFEIGGHSLLAVQVISRLRQTLGVEISLSELFAKPVLSDFAQSLSNAAQVQLPAITPVERDQPMPLSFAQQRLWFLSQLGDHVSRAYHMPLGLRLHGSLNRSALRQALDQIVVRHEALRTTFESINDEPVQRIAAATASVFTLIEHDLKNHPEASSELEQLKTEEAEAPFDLHTGPLIRGRLITLADDEHVLLITQHHILSDGWSLGVLVSELSQLYAAYRNGNDNPLPPLTIQYADYAIWQRRWLTGTALQRQADYWKSTLIGAPALLELPTDHPRPAEQNYAGGLLEFTLDATLTQGIKSLCQQHGTTMFMTLLASWSLLMARLSGQNDVVIGTPTANRHHHELEGLIGFFVNTLAMRIDLSGAPSVETLLAQVKEKALMALQHQDIPFEQVVDLIQPERSLSHNPLFQVAFAWQNAPGEALQLKDLTLIPLPRIKHTTSIFDLSMHLWDAQDTITGALEYSTALFERTTVERYLGYWRQLLEAMVADDQQCIDQLPMLGGAERHQVLKAWNDTACEFPEHLCVHELFEAQVAKTPMATAIVQGETELTYEQLNRQANQLAHHLRTLGIQPDDRVAICVERGPAMIIGLLAILKAGGAYVPLDPAYPVERLAYMLDDSAPRALLLEQNTLGLFADTASSLPTIDIKTDSWSDLPDTNPDKADIGLKPNHLAYVIYTSGSTGNPKGVLVEHRNVCHFVSAMCKFFDVQSGDRLLQFSSFSFDMFVFELTMTLCRGATLCIAEHRTILAGDYLAEVIRQNSITHIILTPGVLGSLHDDSDLKSIRVLITGGEPLSSSLAMFWNQGRTMLNGYGPTEATVIATMQNCDDIIKTDEPPIGCPVANTRTYVLDTNLQPVPVGVTGELYIGGAGVTRGYLNQPKLTAERFLPDPFSTAKNSRMYKTGDLVRWRTDGSLDYIGRNDFQVKLRGFRIELGEIEARLSENEAIQNAIVVLREDNPGNKQIVAYCVPENAKDTLALEPTLLRQYLLFMVPAAFVSLDTIPLTPNGKVDRAALQSPDYMAYAQKTYEAPEGEVEGIIADIWSELLKRDQIGRHDNFFHIGGHSLIVLQTISRLKRAGINLTVTELFKNPTIESAAAHIAKIDLDLDTDNGKAVLLKAGSEPPLFLIHDGSGLLIYAHMLADLIDLDIAIYGLPALPLADKQLCTVEEMATRLLGMIRNIQPNGDYLLAGWSFGGILAYEIAAQLTGTEQEVSFLAMFDSYYLSSTNASKQIIQDEKEHLLALMQVEAFGNHELQEALQELRRFSIDMDLNAIIKQANTLKQFFMPAHLANLPSEEISDYLSRQHAFHAAAMEYVAETIPSRIHLFIAESNVGDMDQSASLGWSELVPQNNITGIKVGGTHYSMMTSPHIELLAKELTDSLQIAVSYRILKPRAAPDNT